MRIPRRDPPVFTPIRLSRTLLAAGTARPPTRSPYASAVEACVAPGRFTRALSLSFQGTVQASKSILWSSSGSREVTSFSWQWKRSLLL